MAQKGEEAKKRGGEERKKEDRDQNDRCKS